MSDSSTPIRHTARKACLWAVIPALLSALTACNPYEAKKNRVDPYANNCLNTDGLNKLSGDMFDGVCEGKTFVATIYPTECSTVQTDCLASLSDPFAKPFNLDSLFEIELRKGIDSDVEKLDITGKITGRGLLGQVEVDILRQKAVPLTEDEISAREEALKPRVDPLAEARKLHLEAREADNKRMIEYAEKNDKQLQAQSTEVRVEPDSVNGMAEWRYYLKNGKVISCLRGYNMDVFVYECKEFDFSR